MDYYKEGQGSLMQARGGRACVHGGMMGLRGPAAAPPGLLPCGSPWHMPTPAPPPAHASASPLTHPPHPQCVLTPADPYMPLDNAAIAAKVDEQVSGDTSEGKAGAWAQAGARAA